MMTDTQKALDSMPERYGKNQSEYVLPHWFDIHYETISAALQNAGGWNFDMDAAPKDGTHFIGLDKNEEIKRIFFETGYGKFEIYGDERYWFIPIAHMPLPPTPSENEGR